MQNTLYFYQKNLSVVESKGSRYSTICWHFQSHKLDSTLPSTCLIQMVTNELTRMSS